MGRPRWRLLALLALAIAVTWWTVPVEEGPQYVLWQDAEAYASLVPGMTAVVHPAWAPEEPAIVWSERPSGLGPATFVRQMRWEGPYGSIEVQVVQENGTRDGNGTLVPGSVWVAAATPVGLEETLPDAGGRLLAAMRELDPGFDQDQWGSTTPQRDDVPIVAIQGPRLDLQAFLGSRGGLRSEPPPLAPRTHGFPIDTSGIVVAFPDARLELASTVWYKQTPQGLLIVDGFGRIQLSSSAHWDSRDEAIQAAREAVAWADVSVPTKARVGFLPA